MYKSIAKSIKVTFGYSVSKQRLRLASTVRGPHSYSSQKSRSRLKNVLFTRPKTSFFSKIFIKNGPHSTIHTFKNYFATMFSVFNFQFSIINNIQTDPKYNTKVNKFLYQILVHFPLMEPSFALEVNKSERI